MYYALRFLMCLALAAAAGWSIRLARADAAYRQRTPQDIARAIELEPESGEYLAALALQAEYSGQDATALQEEIARLNPRASAPRIRLGLAAELHGDPDQAERWLKYAYAVDRQFETRWTLANFYFRQGRRDEFWTWMKSALEMSYGDRVAAFDLCWQASSDAQEILERAIPDHREVVASYLAYTLNHHKQGAILGAANRLARIHTNAMRTPEDLPLLYAATDAVLDPDLWQALGNPRPNGITHPSFEEPHIGHGFDWIFIETAGVTHQSLEGHRIRFSGQQPESCDLLRQVVGGLRPGAAYTLHWEARTQDIASPSGLAWRIDNRTAEIAGSVDWSAGKMTFTPDSDRVVLVLTYRRPEGQVRTQGSVDLKQVTTSSPE
jgi:tetratricopeptide (TPR) repeat protein